MSIKSLNSSSVSFGGYPLRAIAKRIESIALTVHPTADTELPALTPIAYDTNTNKYALYDQTDDTNGKNRIVAFVWPSEQVQTAGVEAKITVMVAGEIFDYADIPTNGAAAGDFLVDFHASNLREKNIFVKNVDDFNQ